MAKWTGLERPITLEAAEAEIEVLRLFSRPPRRLSAATTAALEQADRVRVLVGPAARLGALVATGNISSLETGIQWVPTGEVHQLTGEFPQSLDQANAGATEDPELLPIGNTPNPAALRDLAGGEFPQSLEQGSAGAAPQSRTNWSHSNPPSTGRASSLDAPGASYNTAGDWTADAGAIRPLVEQVALWGAS